MQSLHIMQSKNFHYLLMQKKCLHLSLECVTQVVKFKKTTLRNNHFNCYFHKHCNYKQSDLWFFSSRQVWMDQVGYETREKIMIIVTHVSNYGVFIRRRGKNVIKVVCRQAKWMIFVCLGDKEDWNWWKDLTCQTSTNLIRCNQKKLHEISLLLSH